MIENQLDRIATALERIALAAGQDRVAAALDAIVGRGVRLGVVVPEVVVPGVVDAEPLARVKRFLETAGLSDPEPKPDVVEPEPKPEPEVVDAEPDAPTEKELQARCMALVRKNRALASQIKSRLRGMDAATLKDLDAAGRLAFADTLAGIESDV